MNSQVPDHFSVFVETCEKIRSISKKNEKIEIISEYIANLDENSLSIAVLFLSGRVFPAGSNISLNIGFTTIMQSLSEIAMLDIKDIQNIHFKHGDIGAIAEYAISKKYIMPLFNQQDKLNLTSLYHYFQKIATISGSGSNRNKKNILKGLLIASTPIESKYIIKIITGEMRIGSVESLVEIAISRAFDKELKNIREAMLISGDISQVAVLAKKNLLHHVVMKPFVPLSFMLADVMFSAEEIINYYNKSLICEYKYDGIRLQLHKFNKEVRFFSRNLVEITYAFPELVKAAIETILKTTNTIYSNQQVDFIVDGEVVGFKNGKPLPFQELQKRLRRKKITDNVQAEIPVYYFIYDIMYFKNNSVLKKSLFDRKDILDGLSFKEPITNSNYKIVETIEKVIAIFNESKDIGHEGLVVKDPLSQYHPGKRGRYWMKLKKELDTIDAVIVIAEYGHGKRAGVLSDYTFAVIDKENNNNNNNDDNNSNNNHYKKDDMLKIIGKAYSGLTDKEIDEMTKKLKEIVVEDKGNRIIVKPEIVLEVAFDTIQKSNRHNSGFALRFPRIKNIRIDKGINDIDTLEKVRQIYNNQVYVKHNKNIKENK